MIARIELLRRASKHTACDAVHGYRLWTPKIMQMSALNLIHRALILRSCICCDRAGDLLQALPDHRHARLDCDDVGVVWRVSLDH